MKKMVRTMLSTEFVAQADDLITVCRCEEITKGEIRKAVHEGMRSANEIKRYLRAGMGLCQGQTCNNMIRFIIAKELGVSVSEISLTTPRAPARPVEMGVLANDNYKKQVVG